MAPKGQVLFEDSRFPSAGYKNTGKRGLAGCMLSTLSNKGRGTIKVDKINFTRNRYFQLRHSEPQLPSGRDRARMSLEGGTAPSNGRSTSATLSYLLQATSHPLHCSLLAAPAESVSQALHLHSSTAECTQAVCTQRGCDQLQGLQLGGCSRRAAAVKGLNEAEK